jgi:hypothetical protein
VHAAVLGGRSGDVRGVGKAHEERVNAALDAALEIAGSSGHPATDAARQAIVTTLRALPADEPPGRLTRTLQPGGFEMLAGLSIGGGKAGKAAPITAAFIPAPAHKPDKPDPRRPGARDAKAISRARDAVTAATRALKQAEHTAQREEFERARAAKDLEKAARTVAAARQAVENAERELQEAEADETAARRKKDASERSAREAAQAVESAHARLEAARKDMDALG